MAPLISNNDYVRDVRFWWICTSFRTDRKNDRSISYRHRTLFLPFYYLLVTNSDGSLPVENFHSDTLELGVDCLARRSHGVKCQCSIDRIIDSMNSTWIIRRKKNILLQTNWQKRGTKKKFVRLFCKQFNHVLAGCKLIYKFNCANWAGFVRRNTDSLRKCSVPKVLLRFARSHYRRTELTWSDTAIHSDWMKKKKQWEWRTKMG